MVRNIYIYISYIVIGYQVIQIYRSYRVYMYHS